MVFAGQRQATVCEPTLFRPVRRDTVPVSSREMYSSPFVVAISPPTPQEPIFLSPNLAPAFVAVRTSRLLAGLTFLPPNLAAFAAAMFFLPKPTYLPPDLLP